MTAVAWISELPAWLLLLTAVAAAWVFYRGGGGTAIQSLQAANNVLEARLRQLEQQAKQDAATIAELRGRTDIALAIAPLIEWTVHHEAHSTERHVATLRVLDLIAQRLGPDPNGA